MCCATLQFLRRVQYLFAIYLRYRAPALSRTTESWLFHVSDPPHLRHHIHVLSQHHRTESDVVYPTDHRQQVLITHWP